jgi:hypothetical protein
MPFPCGLGVTVFAGHSSWIAIPFSFLTEVVRSMRWLQTGQIGWRSRSNIMLKSCDCQVATYVLCRTHPPLLSGRERHQMRGVRF